MNAEFLIMGIGVGCWMYAFVNGRYNKKKWSKSTYFWLAGAVLLFSGALLWLI